MRKKKKVIFLENIKQHVEDELNNEVTKLKTKQGRKQTFEEFLMNKHAEQYVGTKHCMTDDFNTFLVDLSADEYIEYGDEFALVYLLSLTTIKNCILRNIYILHFVLNLRILLGNCWVVKVYKERVATSK